MVSIDATRLTDPEIAAEGERDRLKALAGRFSREDFMRAFDVLAKADTELRGSAQPRFHLEMALLRWLHLRKLTPLGDVIAALTTAWTAPCRGPRRIRGARITTDSGKPDRHGF